MEANQDFLQRSEQFWGYVRIISEKVGYTDRLTRIIKSYSEEEILTALVKEDISIDKDLLEDVLNYLEYRTNILNNHVRNSLMNLKDARTIFYQLKKIYDAESFTSKLPYNKQKEEKRDYAYLTGIINILTEQHLREFAHTHGLEYEKDITFDDDPNVLSYLKDSARKIQGAFSRRFDGAYPSTINPIVVWEIKEYYYTTTFGSRIADGVFETQLDGHEINKLSHLKEGDIKHIYFIDSYPCWWEQGKSYLCRIIDMLHMGLVDEVIFGKEVFNRWTVLLDEFNKSESLKSKE
ncbi:hypothetical protein KO561_04265 [Radiobacillus kanasensis]|uniref:DUF7687 domain-containing protein n=1 Tax=Radiobacillus kanasensis TaxID=2844358 RepID=UPI001E59B53C|nr:hypothetical protein [Radiobacillus kanasensis]UFU00171.1 hypothetical protein KO561_04265 [Radiobacillus kanasensis]